MQHNASFLTTLEQPCMISRLKDELREALREFREDPRDFITSALKDDAVGGRRRMLLQVGMAIGISFYAIAFISMLVFWSIAHHQRPRSAGETPLTVISVPYWPPSIEMPKDENKAGGGGGGGRNKIDPPSIGIMPIPSLTESTVAPRPEATTHPPVLPVIETVVVDPRIQFKRDDLTPTGLPDGASFMPSAGPGTDG